MLLRLLQRLFRSAPRAPADPRLAQDPWLGALFARLGERYLLAPDGSRILRRTGRARFNAMPVFLDSSQRIVRGDYEVRGDPARGKSILDARVSGPLAALGLTPAEESVEEWAGAVLTRSYQGRCDSAEQAAAAVKFFCEESELQINTAAET
jgi:hypothetical protein